MWLLKIHVLTVLVILATPNSTEASCFCVSQQLWKLRKREWLNLDRVQSYGLVIPWDRNQCRGFFPTLQAGIFFFKHFLQGQWSSTSSQKDEFEHVLKIHNSLGVRTMTIAMNSQQFSSLIRKWDGDLCVHIHTRTLSLSS